MDREPRLRIMRVSEDADEDGTLVVPDYDDVDPGEAPPDEPVDDRDPPSGWAWKCEECGHLNGGWDPCETCGQPREDEWG